ncbi:MAG: hypothetical protein II004_00160, partial [Erysipelotrichaceae bacterium]|nr:hypothetical protein [Erysipelotrichaceae bacterium]
SQSRQQEGTWPMIGEIVYGTKGVGGAGWLDDYQGNPIWRYQGEVTYLIHNASDTELIIKTDMFKEMLEYAGLNEASYTKGELKIGPYTSIILQ